MVPSLLLATSFAPAVGGMETLLYQTSRRLSSPPLVLAPPPAAAADMRVYEIRAGALARLSYRPLWALHPSLHYLMVFLKPALAAVRSHRPAVIQVGHVAQAPLAWLLARRTRRPFVVYAYGQEVWRARPRSGVPPIDMLLRGRALAAADAVLPLGSFTAGLLTDWGVRRDRMVFVPFGAEPRPSAEPPSGRRLLSVCRLVPRKGVDTVIKALPQLPPHTTYRVVGSGPDEARLRRLALESGVADRVNFLGRLDDAALADEYREASLFVLPSRRTADGELEGYGLVYFEAAAWGRPVVAGRSGGEVDAVEDGVTGCLVDGSSVDDVARVVGGLLQAPDRLRAMGDAGRRRVESTYNWSRAAQAVDALLARVAA